MSNVGEVSPVHGYQSVTSPALGDHSHGLLHGSTQRPDRVLNGFFQNRKVDTKTTLGREHVSITNFTRILSGFK